GWSRTAAWEDERRAVADEVVRPALARWIATVEELLPRSRPSDRAGLVWLPGGEEDYARAIRIFTTLPRSPEELYQTGLDQVAAPGWTPGRSGWEPGWACPGGTRCSPRCATRRARSPPRRPSARRWPRCGGPRRGPASCSRSRSRRRAR